MPCLAHICMVNARRVSAAWLIAGPMLHVSTHSSSVLMCHIATCVCMQPAAPRAPTVGGSTTTGTRSAAEGATEDSDGGQGVEEDSEGEEEEDDSEEEEEEGDKEGGGSDDMALAWDMLEYARTIYNEVRFLSFLG